ncbi:hypothetical protein HHI36_014142 [Cryptolaemus montrouzieri]|uniref:Uncharacterized protein n=1 Tax=Cryptolaemus montrouzieri TaxID=559131 RepID=A0ABD2N280_9CUCU
MEIIDFNGWKTVLDAFANSLAMPVPKYNSEFDFHSAIDFEETKDPVAWFESFITPVIIDKLCEWSNRRADIYFETDVNPVFTMNQGKKCTLLLP